MSQLLLSFHNNLNHSNAEGDKYVSYVLEPQ